MNVFEKIAFYSQLKHKLTELVLLAGVIFCNRLVVGRIGSQFEGIPTKKGRSGRFFVECHRGVRSGRTKARSEGDGANRNAPHTRALSSANQWRLRTAGGRGQRADTAGAHNTIEGILHVR